jgi:hypothetical protein
MTAILNWIFNVFSSAAALGEISFIALLAAVITYWLDLSKKRAERNAVLYEVRKNAYGKTISDTVDEVKNFNNRVNTFLKQYDDVKGGGIYSKIDDVKVKNLYDKDPLNSISLSSTISGLLKSTEHMVMAGTIVLNFFSRFSDPNFMRNYARDSKDIPAGEKERVMALFDTDNSRMPEAEIELWIKKIEDLERGLKESVNLIKTQHAKELLRLSPKDTWMHRRQDKKQVRKNQEFLSSQIENSLSVGEITPLH